MIVNGGGYAELNIAKIYSKVALYQRANGQGVKYDDDEKGYCILVVRTVMEDGGPQQGDNIAAIGLYVYICALVVGKER